MKNQNKKIPKIRFESFEKRWESYQLSEYSSYRRGSFPQPYGNKEWYRGNNAMPFVQVVDVLENLRLVADTKQKISNLAQPMSVFVPSNSVIVTLQGSIGRVAITQYDAYVDRTILIFEDYISQTNKEFWAYTIRNKFEIERQKAPGGTIKTITKEALSDFKVLIPSYSEQSAIGSLFRTLDDLLASYKDNLANYQSLKATMLSKMFPKAGQTVPEIRLDGFKGEWEKGTIGEFGSFYYGKSAPKWSVTDGATTPCVRYGELYTKFSTKIDKIYSYTSIPKENLKLSSGNEVLVPRVGENPFDFANCSWLSLKGVAIGEMISVYNTPNNPLFIAYYFNAKMKKEFAKRVEGGSVANLYYTYLENISISVPSLPEQQAIGAYFLNLDNLINSHQEKISQLETLKKKLLQDMFI